MKFAIDLYKAAITTAESTRVDSLQQQRFISIVSYPQIPDQQDNNWRHKGFLSFSFILSFNRLIQLFKVLFILKEANVIMKEKLNILFYLSIKNILKYFPIYSIHDFNLKTKSKFKERHKINIILSGNNLYPNQHNKIILTCKKNKSWMVHFGILHYGENEKCYGNIFLGNSYFVQGRPMFPRRRRWRILRIKSKSNVNIILENVYYPKAE